MYIIQFFYYCRFSVGSMGRLCVGLYVLFIEKWLEHFPVNQFLILQLETYNLSPQSYINKIIKFLSLDMPLNEEEKGLLINKMIQKEIGNKNK